jgi:hypothetical protein
VKLSSSEEIGVALHPANKNAIEITVLKIIFNLLTGFQGCFFYIPFFVVASFIILHHFCLPKCCFDSKRIHEWREFEAFQPKEPIEN